jgi:hypothetical protein
MTTVNPVQSATYSLTTNNNPITFGPGTNIDVSNGYGAVYGGPGVSWNVTNLGAITGSGSIYLGGGSLTNAGSINGGVWLQTSATVNNQAGGTINGNNPGGGYGVALYGGGSVNNAGQIASYGVAVEVDDGGVAHNLAGGTISGGYVGVITGLPTYSHAGGGTIVNYAGGTITGESGIAAYLNPATVTNAGAITGTTATTVPAVGEMNYTFDLGYGVSMRAGGTVDNESGGTITGAVDGVYITGGPGTVTNAGTISGATGSVAFYGPYADTLILQAGSTLNGDIVVSDGASLSVTGFGAGDTIDFASGSGNAASLYGADSGWGAVFGSDATVALTNAQASVVGGGDQVVLGGGSTASLYNTGGDWDWVNGSGGTVGLTSAQTSLVGGGDQVILGAGSTASLYNTGGDWDWVNGSNGTIGLTNAQSSVVGGGDQVVLGSGSAASLYNTGGDWDWVNGSGGTIGLTNAQSSVVGGGDQVVLGAGSAASVYNTGGDADSVSGSNGKVGLTNAQASVVGGGDQVVLGGSGDVLSLYDGAGDGVTVNAGANIDIGSNNGQVDISNFATDSTGIISLLNGVGGYTSVSQVLAALTSDGHGGSLLPLPSTGSIDFAGVAPSVFTAANFKIG